MTGLPGWATPYVLRPTAASLLAQSDVPVTAAAAALGHDPATFLRTYAHLYPGDLGAVADAMDAVRCAVIESDGGCDDMASNSRPGVKSRYPLTGRARCRAGMARRRRQQAETQGL